MARLLFLLTTCAACLGPLLVAGQQDGGGVPIQELPQFSVVQVCVPFNVLISPSTGSPAYGLQVSAEPAVSDAIKWTVSNGTLALETGGFVTSQPIKVVIYLPADQFTELDHLGQLSNVYVADGFNPPSFTLRQGAGGGGVFVFGMQAGSLTVSTQGSIGDIVLMGSYGTVDLTSQGIANIYISGISQSITVQLGGITSLYLETASPQVTISGRADGISNIFYDQGQCSVQSSFLLTSPCQQSSSISVAQSVPSPTWTQGQTAVGAFSCAVGAAFLTQTLQIPAVQAMPFPSLLPLPIIPFPTQPAPAPAPAPVPAASPTPAPSPVPSPPAKSTASAQATAGAGRSPPPTTVVLPPAPPPSPEAGGPYAFIVPGPTGTQTQAGSATPGGPSQAQAGATGQRQAVASAVAGPGGAATGTRSDNQTAAGSTRG
ncbi:hypothetical protein ABPG75_012421 [Micractinium tetrahymenae]